MKLHHCKTIALPINLQIKDGTLANVTKSLLIGKNDAGSYNNVKLDNENHLAVNATNPKTSYEELPVANLSPIAQIAFPYNINTDIVDIETAGGGTAIQGDNMALISTGAGTQPVESAKIGSKRTVTFRPGEGALARFSALFTDLSPNEAGTIQGIGIGDANDGYGFAYVGDAFGISYRTNGVQTDIPQINWNTDVMDGSGSASNPSGMNLLTTKGNVYQISYGSGFGCINFSIESDNTGDMILVHVLHIANLNITPSSYNPTFPITAEVFKDGSASTGNYVLKVSDMSCFIEGNNVPTGPIKSTSNRSSSITSGSDRAILAIKVSDTFPIGSTSVNKVNVILKSLGLLNDANKAALFDLVLNPTPVTTPTWIDINPDTSVIEYATNVEDDAINISTGTVLWSGGLAKDAGINVDISNLGLFLTPGDILYATINIGSGASGVDEAISIVWQEDF